jgi:hypothetical protein
MSRIPLLHYQGTLRCSHFFPFLTATHTAIFEKPREWVLEIFDIWTSWNLILAPSDLLVPVLHVLLEIMGCLVGLDWQGWVGHRQFIRPVRPAHLNFWQGVHLND